MFCPSLCHHIQVREVNCKSDVLFFYAELNLVHDQTNAPPPISALAGPEESAYRLPSRERQPPKRTTYDQLGVLLLQYPATTIPSVHCTTGATHATKILSAILHVRDSASMM